MKRLLIILFFASIFATNLDAQTADRKWAVGLYGGANQYNGDLGNGFYSFSHAFYEMGAISIDRYLTPHFDVSLQGALGKVGYLDSKGHLLTKMMDFNVNARYNILNEETKLNPFVFAGIGAMRFDDDVKQFDNWAFPVAGFGLTYKVTPAISIRLQESFIFSDYDKMDGMDDDQDKNYFKNDKYLKHSIGIVFNIGKMKDSDGDGIADKKDICPEIAGLKEFNGCPDTDGDGIEDSEDACPKVKGLKEFNGCADTDGDGIADNKDACPNVKGLAKFKGCPDTDGDGIADAEDKCPKVKGLAKFKGCPDTDGDGIADADDRCPKVKGTIKTHGCPDRDGDGIVDSKDACPDKAGIASLKGCPKMKEEKKKEVEKAIRFSAKNIQFNTGKSTIRTTSFKDIDKVIAILNQYPNIKFYVEGHTDNTGNYNKNKTLSQARADAVKEYMVRKGISSFRLQSIGYGSDKPIATNKTRKGRQQNRRVEFIINQ